MVGHNVKDVFVQILLRFSFALILLTSDEPKKVPRMERRVVRKSYRLRQEEPLGISFHPTITIFLSANQRLPDADFSHQWNAE